MFIRSRRQIRKQLLIFAVMVAIMAVCSVIYLLFLYLEGNPVAERAVADLIQDLIEDQAITDIKLNLSLDSEQMRLDCQAQVVFVLPKNREQNFLRRCFFFFPSDLIVFLHPDLKVEKVKWGDRELSIKRIKSAVYIDINGALPSDGIIDLTINYSGRFSDDRWCSIFTKDLIYLDPEDNYYPNQGPCPCNVKVRMNLPSGYTSIVPGISAKDGSGNSIYSFSSPNSSFVLAGGTMTPTIPEREKMTFSFYGWNKKNEKEIAGKIAKLEKIEKFYMDRLPDPVQKNLRFIKSPIPLDSEMRFNETSGTVLYSRLNDEDLAFILARAWLKIEEAGSSALFSGDELAYGLSLYYTQHEQGREAYLERLDRIADKISLAKLYPSLDKALSAKLSTERAAFLLSVFRRKVGNDIFDEILKEIVSNPQNHGSKGWEEWNDLCQRFSGVDFSWFFRDWVGQNQSLDLAIVDMAVESHLSSMGGQEVIVKLKKQNLGDLDLAEKVKILYITESGVEVENRQISRSLEIDQSNPIEEKLIGVILDPDLDWLDINRNNNIAYLDPPPYSIMPSEDDNFMAVAYHKRIDDDHYSLVILNRKEDEPNRFSKKMQLSLESPVGEMHWINQSRLLVSFAPKGCFDSIWTAGAPRLLIDVENRWTEVVESDVELSASHTGRYLLLNRKHTSGWRHKLRDLDQKFTRSILNNKIPYPVKWIPGSEYIIPEYPPKYIGEINIYTQHGEYAYPFPKIDKNEHVSNFFYFQGDLAFIWDRNGEKGLYLLTDPRISSSAKPLFKLKGDPISIYCSKYDEMIYLKEAITENTIRITRVDPIRKEKFKILFEDSAEGIYDIFWPKGVLTRRIRKDEIHGDCPDINFQGFEDIEGRFLTTSPHSEKALALVGNHRFLYYAEEVQPQGLDLDLFKQYVFHRFDLYTFDETELDFTDWLP